MKSFIREFKDFAIKGNMIDMAVGIIIGTAFNNVVNTLVKKVVMPPLSLLTDDVNLANRKYLLREATDTAEEVAIGYGELIEVLIDFAIIALTIFVVIKFINRFKKKSEDPKNKQVPTPKDIELLANIERLMEQQNELIKNGSKKL
ncbi:large-conductance mechanosensitive channel protein MscL [Altibacter sp.]|uniref:large-conductance mechanosensitive channel protein MscL n=1 Tax=Altibacter sp. TaxID=2024823 RepID=UPI00258DCF56|nr:large-conductance mechanosensitive channel protein MscL [Altibacter sp.]MCW8980604.1 large-conductance mechanosensitive channel protein MscL [Altibacter sp.]MCW9037079.1 large-conductance mechanosensitive channel protein MscL [Altibacter sp.]